MKIDAYGKMFEVTCDRGLWKIFSLGEGKKSPVSEIAIPPHLNKEEVLEFLEDLMHEMATPERPRIVIID